MFFFNLFFFGILEITESAFFSVLKTLKNAFFQKLYFLEKHQKNAIFQKVGQKPYFDFSTVTGPNVQPKVWAGKTFHCRGMGWKAFSL